MTDAQKLSRYKVALVRIANPQHKEGCRWTGVPWGEAPCDCWDPVAIAKEALEAE